MKFTEIVLYLFNCIQNTKNILYPRQSSNVLLTNAYSIMQKTKEVQSRINLLTSVGLGLYAQLIWKECCYLKDLSYTKLYVALYVQSLCEKHLYYSIFVVYASITLHSVATKVISLDPVTKFYSNYLIVGISAKEIPRIKIL